MMSKRLSDNVCQEDSQGKVGAGRRIWEKDAKDIKDNRDEKQKIADEDEGRGTI
ncbi:MAG: hypothetical protein BWZ08_02530 [candidate division BRC1 bacterium ADurb.BinA292]|nr:MAG: hypothetical protein BWZ08_02530 [candidate division BRC1 bacterium ADurb.BinA292]